MTGSLQKLMMAWAWGVILFGAVLMGAAFAALDAPSRWLMALLGGAAPTMDGPLRFAVGLMGAVTFGWGLTVLAVASVSHLLDTQTARALWQRIAAVVVIWYVVDCVISITTGFGLNSLPNTVLLVVFLSIGWRAGVLGASSSVAQKQGASPLTRSTG